MSTTIEIAYYNTFILSGGENPGDWHVEESRIKGGFNRKSVDLGVKAYLVDDKYKPRRRPNAMIYSGVYNSKTNVNQTNQFDISQDITRAVDSAHGSIQKLYAEDTNLIIFQENKVSRALIDKDAIFTQEGQPLTTASKIVIGQIAPFAGKYGISKNPESFAVHAGRKYFTDKKRGVVCRLSQDGITPISDAGMRKFFADNLKNAKRLYGMYDEPKNKYILSMHGKGFFDTKIEFCTNPGLEVKTVTGYYTLAFDELSKGWVSFYTYKPTFGFSLRNEFYTWPLFEEYTLDPETGNIEVGVSHRPDVHNWRFWQHHVDTRPRCNFYFDGFNDPCRISFVINDEPEVVKNFSTIDYTGTDGWEMTQMLTDIDKSLAVKEATWYPPSGQVIGGGYVVQGFNSSRFKKKENKKVAALRSDLSTFWQSQHNLSDFQDIDHPQNNVRVVGAASSGVKGYYANIRFQYWNSNEGSPGTFSTTGLELKEGTKKQELFSVNLGVVTSSESTYL